MSPLRSRVMRCLLTGLVLVSVARVTGVSLEVGRPLTRTNIPVELEELFRRGLNPEEIYQRIQQIAESNCASGTSGMQSMNMQKHLLRNRTVTCNDGSPAGFYIRRTTDSTRWLVYLEGGGYCFDRASCRGRWINTPNLMSSTNWTEKRKGSGILSWDPIENPYLYNANIVFVPYCSSDSWSGTVKSRGEYSFMGSLIIEEVIKQLAESEGLQTASRLILAGSSAGGLGVLLNLDHVAGLMSKVAPKVDVRGIADSGWFLDNLQFKKTECTDVHSCAPTEGIQRGIQLWKGRVPEACKEKYEPREHWRCYFGYRVYDTLKTPVFIVQHLFDEAQIKADNVGPPVKREQWQYIHNMGKDMKRTLHNVSAVFAPACLSHILLTRGEWQQVKINSVTLPEALRCWEEGQHEHNNYDTNHAYQSRIHRLITGVDTSRGDVQLLGDDPDSKAQNNDSKSKKERRKHRKRRRRMKRKRRKGRERERKRDQEPQRERQRNRDRHREREREREHRRRERRSLLFDQHDIHHMTYHGNQCFHHQLDHCAWPQCNLACPKIHNPFTGEEMDFIDLLLQFGLDLSSIANALGMDLPTLQSMDHDLLLRKLTQQS